METHGMGWMIVAVALLGAAGCAADVPQNECYPGETAACACPSGGAAGRTTCEFDDFAGTYRFRTCTCESAPPTCSHTVPEGSAAVFDTCGGNDVCECPAGPNQTCETGGSCRPIDFFEYSFVLVYLEVPSTNRGEGWDALGDAPDLFAAVYAGSTYLGRSGDAVSAYAVQYTLGRLGWEFGRFTIAPGVSTLTVDVFDEDLASNDLAFRCTFTLTAEAVRGVSLDCNGSLGRAFGFLSKY